MKNSSFTQIIRSLHRDIGFFLIGLTVIYCLSGILLVYRESDFLKREVQVEKTIEASLLASSLGRVMHKKIIITGSENGIVKFNNQGYTGTYNSLTGELSYKNKELPSFIQKLINLHKSSEKQIVHWFSVIYGSLLLFLALSSFWMFKPGSKVFKKGVILSLLGGAVAFIIVL